MIAKMTRRLVLAAMIVLFGAVARDSFAAADTGSLTLSEALLQVELFTGLGDAELDALKAIAALSHAQAGERIVEQGKKQDRMFVILAGRAKVRVNGKDVVTLSGQSLVGEMEFLDMLPASADVILLDDTDLVELNNASLNELMEKQPRLGYLLIRRIARIECQRLRASNPK